MNGNEAISKLQSILSFQIDRSGANPPCEGCCDGCSADMDCQEQNQRLINIVDAEFSDNDGELMQKPTLGLRPRYIADKQRLNEIRKSIARYYTTGLPIPVEWIKEYNELVAKEAPDARL